MGQIVDQEAGSVLKFALKYWSLANGGYGLLLLQRQDPLPPASRSTPP